MDISGEWTWTLVDFSGRWGSMWPHRPPADKDISCLQSYPLRRRRLTMLNPRLWPGDRRAPKLAPCKGTTEDCPITAVASANNSFRNLFAEISQCITLNVSSGQNLDTRATTTSRVPSLTHPTPNIKEATMKRILKFTLIELLVVT